MEAIRRIFYVLVMMLALSCNESASDIKGSIGVIMNSGDIKYGSKVDVYLTTKEVSFPAAVSERTQRIRVLGAEKGSHPPSDPIVRNALMFNYQVVLKNSILKATLEIVREMKASDYYVRQRTKSNLSGKFRFADVSPGKYFIVVMYPTTIAMHYVFWQLPIVVENKNLEVELSNDNMALPPSCPNCYD